MAATGVSLVNSAQMDRSRRSGMKSAVMLMFAVCEVVGGLVVVHTMGKVSILLPLLGAVLTSVGLHALGLAQHESFHRLLFKSHRLNDSVGRVLCSWLLFTQFAPLKRAHLAHHRSFGLEVDPDHWHWDDRRNRRDSCKLILHILLFRRIWNIGSILRGADDDRFRRGELPFVFLVQLVMFCLVVSFAGPATYALGWLIPLFSFMPLLEHIRVVAEHHGTALRVFVSPNPLENWVFGRFGFVSHGHHHENPRLSWSELPRETSAISSRPCRIEGAKSWLHEFVLAMG